MPKTRSLAKLRELHYESMTREERVKLMMADVELYMARVPQEYWFQVLDGLAKAGPVTDNK